MTEPIISINDLSVYFNKKKALNNVTMDFYPNEITALIGRNQPCSVLSTEWEI